MSFCYYSLFKHFYKISVVSLLIVVSMTVGSLLIRCILSRSLFSSRDTWCISVIRSLALAISDSTIVYRLLQISCHFSFSVSPCLYLFSVLLFLCLLIICWFVASQSESVHLSVISQSVCQSVSQSFSQLVCQFVSQFVRLSQSVSWLIC